MIIDYTKQAIDIIARFNAVIDRNNNVIYGTTSIKEAERFATLYPAGVYAGPWWITRKPYSKYILAIRMEV